MPTSATFVSATADSPTAKDQAITVPGYTIVAYIDETQLSEVYRARNNETHQAVVIKILKTESPPSSEIARFKHEYELIGRFDIEGVVKLLDIVYIQDRWALVMEDFGGVSLQRFLGSPLPLERFLDLASRLAGILDSLHRNNISHCDIKPRNVIYNSRTDTLKLTDFGIAAELSRSSEQIYNPRVIEATLAYMSPEQTGRMNCVVDYRTDFYSLGVTFYEMLTGKLPFHSREPMKIIHSHIARRPLPPHRLNRDVPEVVSRIVMKLLEKGAGDRYQSSRGLIADLEHCRRQLEASGQVDAFEIGRQDISLKFTMPQVLVGRENEIARLSEAFERASDGAMSFMLVSGAPGIGKSALVNEIDKTVAARQGFFISGKYDHLWRHVPYSAFIQAFQGLARRLLATSDQEIREWKEKLLSVLQPNAKLITDNIPATRLIVGDQPDVPGLAPEEARNRFKHTLKNFVQVFADQSHPLLLFLDDLQWADPASIELIRDLSMDRSLSYFFLIGTYRDNEVPPHHPLMLAVDAAGQAGTQVETIHLAALNESSVNRLLASFLRCDPQDCRSLAAVVHEKTLGNPFFVTQFLKTLYEKKYLTPKPSGGWQWDLTAVREMQITDNVVDFMAEKIRLLPEQALDLIKICACVGNRFDAETLAVLTKKPIHEVFDLLKHLADEGLLVQKQRFFTFHHDRIHEAAYSRISEKKRIHTHYRIGSLALQQTPEEELPDKVFYIADQLNQGRELVTAPEERTRLAGLNLKAGVKAKEATAYEAAADYFGTGMTLLPPDPWQTEYRLTYELHKELMECRFLSRNFDEAKQLFQIVIANAANRVDKARVYTIMIVLYTNINSPEEAIKLGLEALRLFGIKYALKTSPVPVLAELVKLKIRLRKMPLEAILDLPLMTEIERITCHNVMLAMATPAFYANPNLFALIALRGLNESIQYGLNATSSTTLNVVAAIFGNLLGDYEQSYRMGELALQLNQKLDNRKEAGQIHHTFAFFIQHWKKHARNDIEMYQKEYQLCLDVGDFIFAGHSVGATLDCRLMIGHRLDDILAEAEKYRELMRHVKDPFIEARYRENIQMAKCLKGLTEDPLSLDGDEFDAAAHLEALYKEKNLFGICFALLYKMKLYYLYGHYQEAGEVGKELDGHIHAPIGTLLVPEHYFYYCLNLAALLKSAGRRKKRQWTRTIKKYQRKMDKWARHCPENFRHKHDLVQAELLAARGCIREAMAPYHAAVNGARQNGYINEEAIARERAALFYFDINAKEEAMGFLQKAHQCYGRWGP